MAELQPYHHGNLRQTLLDAAVALIGEVGPRVFTLREVARRAGVSHNAPYRHFASKDELLVAVASEGFDRLTRTMEEHLVGGQSPAERLALAGCGYVDFVLRWPNHFLVMFELPATLGEECRQVEIGENAFQVLLDCIVAAQGSGEIPVGDPMPHAFTAWSLVHGIAKLAISGNLPMDAAATLGFAHTAAMQMLRGLRSSPSTVEG